MLKRRLIKYIQFHVDFFSLSKPVQYMANLIPVVSTTFTTKYMT